MRISDWSSDVCSSDLRRGETGSGDGDGDRELEIIACRGEGDRRRARIIGFDELPHPETDDELDDEIDGERDRNPHNVTRNGDDLAAFDTEHGTDREEQRDQIDRVNHWKEASLVQIGRDSAWGKVGQSG